MHTLSDGTSNVYIAANGTIIGTTTTATPEDLEIPCSASTHLADFAAMGDTVYIACGRELVGYKRDDVSTPVALTAVGAGTWNDDYTTPVGGHMPQAELCESHAGYLFVANTEEDGVDHPNRIRWSHPTSQGDWAEFDYIDILSEGSAITALMSFQDHLLVFKSDGLWAIYGYNLESWQVIKKSTTIGTPGPQAVTRSETAVFFYSSSDHGSIYAYAGEMPTEISPQLRRSFSQITHHELIWVGWLRRKLWVTVPWDFSGPKEDSAGAFVFDPSVGENGCWMFYTSQGGGLGPLVGGTNSDSSSRPMAVFRATEDPNVMLLDANEQTAHDVISNTSGVAVIASGGDVWNPSVLVTDTGEIIVVSGMPGVFPYRTIYRTPWLTAGWPTRKKSFRRPDFVCRRTGLTHALQIQSYRDYEEANARRQHAMVIDGQGTTVWGEFDWGDGSEWGAGRVAGNRVVRGGSFGLCKALQVRITNLTPGARWGIDAIVMKLVLRRFH
jgi:hypothetical protein